MKPESKAGGTPKGKKKVRGPKKKNKKDPNEPQKPISAYALFFRDTQAVIKRQNPNATFGEVSKIVASMWDSLDPDAKNVYKERTELARIEYLKALSAYRASLASMSESNDSGALSVSVEGNSSPPIPTSPASSPSAAKMSPSHSKSPTSTVTDDLPQPNEEEVITVQLPDVIPIEEKPLQTVIDISSPSKEQDVNGDNEPIISNGTVIAEVQICLRSGCTNPAVDSPEWDQEYCSSKCVVEHCSSAFMAHVAARQKNAVIEIS